MRTRITIGAAADASQRLADRQFSRWTLWRPEVGQACPITTPPHARC